MASITNTVAGVGSLTDTFAQDRLTKRLLIAATEACTDYLSDKQIPVSAARDDLEIRVMELTETIGHDLMGQGILMSDASPNDEPAIQVTFNSVYEVRGQTWFEARAVVSLRISRTDVEFDLDFAGPMTLQPSDEASLTQAECCASDSALAMSSRAGLSDQGACGDTPDPAPTRDVKEHAHRSKEASAPFRHIRLDPEYVSKNYKPAPEGRWFRHIRSTCCSCFLEAVDQLKRELDLPSPVIATDSQCDYEDWATAALTRWMSKDADGGKQQIYNAASVFSARLKSNKNCLPDPSVIFAEAQEPWRRTNEVSEDGVSGIIFERRCSLWTASEAGEAPTKGTDDTPLRSDFVLRIRDTSVSGLFEPLLKIRVRRALKRRRVPPPLIQ